MQRKGRKKEEGRRVITIGGDWDFRCVIGGCD